LLQAQARKPCIHSKACHLSCNCTKHPTIENKKKKKKST
jgi:hypothetical protein